jgi:hypothetical protein
MNDATEIFRKSLVPVVLFPASFAATAGNALA